MTRSSVMIRVPLKLKCALRRKSVSDMNEKEELHLQRTNSQNKNFELPSLFSDLNVAEPVENERPCHCRTCKTREA